MSSSRVYLVVKYAVFAGISIGVNLLAQRASLYVYRGAGAIYAALAAGTLCGLVTKYVLDKQYIFYHRSSTLADDSRMFFVYSAMGVITTAIFWGTELTFHALLPYAWAKYAGGAIGLSVGYSVKYRLDKRFVFTKKCRRDTCP